MAGFPDPRCVKLSSGLSKRRNAVGGLDLDTRQTPQSPFGFHRGDRIASRLAVWQHIGCIGAVLSEIESRLDQPIGNYFDLVAGTSTGGLIAAAVAKRYTRLNFEIPHPSWSLDSVEHLPSLLHKGRTVAHGRHFDGSSSPFVFGPLVMNRLGDIAYGALLTGTNVDDSNDTGIWFGPPGSPNLAVRTGTHAPGTLGEVNFAGVVGSELLLEDSGKIAFRGSMTGTGVNDSNKEGIWAGTPGSLNLIAREGSPAPGLDNSLKYDGFYQILALNSSGQVAFTARLRVERRLAKTARQPQ